MGKFAGWASGVHIFSDPGGIWWFGFELHHRHQLWYGLHLRAALFWELGLSVPDFPQGEGGGVAGTTLLQPFLEWATLLRTGHWYHACRLYAGFPNPFQHQHHVDLQLFLGPVHQGWVLPCALSDGWYHLHPYLHLVLARSVLVFKPFKSI